MRDIEDRSPASSPASRIVIVADGRFTFRNGRLESQSSLTGGLRELVESDRLAVTMLCRPCPPEMVSFEFPVSRPLNVKQLPDWSRRGAVGKVLQVAWGIAREIEPDVPVISIGPSLSQTVLLVFSTIRRRMKTRILYLVRSHPTDSLLLGAEGKSPLWRKVFGIYLFAWRSLMSRQTHVACVSRDLANQLGLWHSYIAPEVHWSELEAIVATEDAREGILFVGRLEPEKGADIAVKAATSLGRLEGLPLTVVGVGGLGGELAELGGDTVRFAGSMDRADLLAEMARSRLVVVPSRTEAFGLVALEASLAGARVLHSGRGGLDEACGWWRGATRLPTEDVDCWRESMAALTAEPEIAGRVRASEVRAQQGWGTLLDCVLELDAIRLANQPDDGNAE